MHKLAVIGNPVEHSLSPLIWGLFAKEVGVELDYQKILAKDEKDFALQAYSFFKAGGMAINVTSPFKQNSFFISDLHTSRASFCKATNFLSITNSGQILADTTDGIGLVNDLILNKNENLGNKNILIIGSGFVLNSVLLDLIVYNPLSIDILARKGQRIEFLHDKFATDNFNPQKNYDIIINTTPNSLDNTLFGRVEYINNNVLCYDMTYTKSLFLNAMQNLNSNIRVYNGLGMLVEQAKVAFIKLFAQTPNSKAVFESLFKMGYHV